MPDKDTLALYRILAEPGRWMVFVHQGHIVKLTKLPPEQPVDVVIGAKNAPKVDSSMPPGTMETI